MKPLNFEDCHPSKRPFDDLSDKRAERNFESDVTARSQHNANASAATRRRIEEYLEKKRLRELLQEEYDDDVFNESRE